MLRHARGKYTLIGAYAVLCAAAVWAQEPGKLPGKLDMEAAEIVSELIGRPVFARDGAQVGTVADLLLDASGLPQMLRMTTGKHLGLGGHTVEVPQGAFMTLRGAVVLDFSAEDVGLLPHAHEPDDER